MDSDFSLSSCGLRLIGQIFSLPFIRLLPDSSCRAILRTPTPSLPSLILPNPAGHYLPAREHPTRNRSRKPGPDPTAPYLSSPFANPLTLLTWSTFPNPLDLAPVPSINHQLVPCSGSCPAVTYHSDRVLTKAMPDFSPFPCAVSADLREEKLGSTNTIEYKLNF